MQRIIFAIIFAIGFMTAAFADYSEGYRMGMLEKYSVSGMFNKSGEGFLNMGREGAPVIKTDKDGNKTYVNPWAFSADLKQFSQQYMNNYAGSYVIIKYRQDFFNSGLTQKTAYNMTGIEKIDTTKNQPVACQDPGAKGSKSEGFRVGRIVKASTKGTFGKSYEITIQVGNSGNLYFPMSALSKEMYECTIANMKAGKQVKVFYAKAWFNLGISQDSEYSIVRIEPVSDI